MPEDLITIGEKILNLIENEVDQAEIYIARAKGIAIKVENGVIKTARQLYDQGIGIRVIKNKAIGYAYVTSFEQSEIEKTAKQAIDLAKASTPDSDFVSLPSYNGKYPIVNGRYDKNIEYANPEDVAELMKRAIDAAKIDARVYSISGEASASFGEKCILNTLGIKIYDKATQSNLYIYSTVKEYDEMMASYEMDESRIIKDLNPESVGKRATEFALRSLHPKKIETGTMDLILDPMGIMDIFGTGLGRALNAEEVMYERSYLAGLLNQQIGSDILHIEDNARIDGGIASRIFDAEGYPSQQTQIFEKGVLKSYLHNSYTANKMNTMNTGNASRYSYAGLPSISITNLIIQPMSGTQDDLISEVQKGILLRSTGDTPNMVTGDLSALVSQGFYIENGEIKHPVKETLIGINMKDLFSNITRIAADVRRIGPLITPSMLVKDVKVASK